ncbi:hypothetical protein JTS98_14505 [Clostridium botulinum]|nr:hypothetical protein [Clostridium botulinum]
MNFINNSRERCREEKRQGYIYFNIKENKMGFNIAYICKEDFIFQRELL